MNAEKARHTRKELLKSVRDLSNEADSETKTTNSERGGPAAASSSLDFFLNNDQYYVNQSVSEIERVRRRTRCGDEGPSGIRRDEHRSTRSDPQRIEQLLDHLDHPL